MTKMYIAQVEVYRSKNSIYCAVIRHKRAVVSSQRIKIGKNVQGTLNHPVSLFFYLGMSGATISERETSLFSYFAIRPFFFLFHVRGRTCSTSVFQLTCDAREHGEARMVESRKCTLSVV